MDDFREERRASGAAGWQARTDLTRVKSVRKQRCFAVGVGLQAPDQVRGCVAKLSIQPDQRGLLWKLRRAVAESAQARWQGVVSLPAATKSYRACLG